LHIAFYMTLKDENRLVNPRQNKWICYKCIFSCIDVQSVWIWREKIH